MDCLDGERNRARTSLTRNEIESNAEISALRRQLLTAQHHREQLQERLDGLPSPNTPSDSVLIAAQQSIESTAAENDRLSETVTRLRLADQDRARELGRVKERCRQLSTALRQEQVEKASLLQMMRGYTEAIATEHGSVDTQAPVLTASTARSSAAASFELVSGQAQTVPQAVDYDDASTVEEQELEKV